MFVQLGLTSVSAHIQKNLSQRILTDKQKKESMPHAVDQDYFLFKNE